MRVAIFGGLGSIGRRYQAILKWMGHEPVVIDSADQRSMDQATDDVDRFIIATPTETHLGYCKFLIDTKKRFLCEKPLSKNLEGIQSIMGYSDGFVVNNYSWTFKSLGLDVHSISYDYYMTGKDGLLWDCCQLVYLDPKAIIRNESPVFELTVNGKTPVDLRAIHWGYVQMIHWFVNCDDNCSHGLWTLEDGYNMSKAVVERMERENAGGHSGEK